MTHLYWQKCVRCDEGLGYGYPSLLCNGCIEVLGDEGTKLYLENQRLKQNVHDLKEQVKTLKRSVSYYRQMTKSLFP